MQVACGGFHSLALVRSLPSPTARTLSLDKCGRCQQLLYTMIDRDDHVIISDNHYCPLGVELNEAKRQSAPEQQQQQGQSSQGSNEVSKEVTPVGSSMTSETFCPALGSVGGSPQVGSEAENMGEPDEGNSTAQTDTAKVPLRRTKSSPFPDEQDLKEYLKRLSLSEHPGTATHFVPSSPDSGKDTIALKPLPDHTPAPIHPAPASHPLQPGGSQPGKPHPGTIPCMHFSECAIAFNEQIPVCPVQVYLIQVYLIHIQWGK